MKNRLLCLAVVGLPVWVSLSCSKQDAPLASPDQISINFSKKALEYVQLTEGTQLVYRDSATSFLDTLMVTKSKLRKLFFPEVECADFFGFMHICPAQNDDQFSLTLTSMVSGAQDAPWFDAETQPNSYLGYTSTVDNAELILFERFHVPTPYNYDMMVVFDYSEPYSGDFVTITVEGIAYQNVIVFKRIYDATGLGIDDPSYRKATYYWAKDVGIIKRTIVTSGGVVKTFTLVSSD